MEKVGYTGEISYLGGLDLMVNMKKVVAAIIIKDEKILVGKKIVKEDHFVSGGWHIPGGRVYRDEDKVDALIREMKEETNLDIEIVEKLTCGSVPEGDVEIHWYVCKPTTVELRPGDDLEDAKFIHRNDVIEFCDARATDLWPKEVLEFLSK